jgi:hypothetical protein
MVVAHARAGSRGEGKVALGVASEHLGDGAGDLAIGAVRAGPLATGEGGEVDLAEVLGEEDGEDATEALRVGRR